MAEQLLETANLPGLSIAVSRNGQVVFAEGFGYADIERKRPITPDTRFRTASVSKVITVTALILTPIVLLYQAWTYHVLRERLAGDEPSTNGSGNGHRAPVGAD